MIKSVFSLRYNIWFKFVCKEASKDQIKYLLVDNNHETVDGAEVEALLNKQAQDVRLKGAPKHLLYLLMCFYRFVYLY